MDDIGLSDEGEDSNDVDSEEGDEPVDMMEESSLALLLEKRSLLLRQLSDGVDVSTDQDEGEISGDSYSSSRLSRGSPRSKRSRMTEWESPNSKSNDNRDLLNTSNDTLVTVSDAVNSSFDSIKQEPGLEYTHHEQLQFGNSSCSEDVVFKIEPNEEIAKTTSQPPPQLEMISSDDDASDFQGDNNSEIVNDDPSNNETRALEEPKSINTGVESDAQIDDLNDEDGAILESASDMDEVKIDQMLEQPMVNYDVEKAQFDKMKQPPEMKIKHVLKNKGTEYFEVLPDGWIEVQHQSGLTVYLHKASRVCTFSRPYFLGPGSVRHHDVPISAIPCLHQQRLRETKEERAMVQKKSIEEAAAKLDLLNGSVDAIKSLSAVPQAEIRDSNDTITRYTTPSQLFTYAQKGFEFEQIKVWRFKNWTDHRQFHKLQRRKARRPTLPRNMKLITVPQLENSCKQQRKPFFMNPHGKSSVSLLHEYVQRVLHCGPTYDYKPTNNAAQPYSATVNLGQYKYATGHGNSKKNAKSDAAKKTLEVLIPGMDFNDISESGSAGKLPNQEGILDLFDQFSINDTRIPKLSAQANQPAPYAILTECLKRNDVFGNCKLDMSIRSVKHQQHEFTMTVGTDRVVKVICSNKQEGKQKASQSMLQQLHPHVASWGSLIRLYGYGSAVTGRGGESDVVGLQMKAVQKSNQKTDEIVDAAPNKAILEKLRQEMMKIAENRALAEKMESIKLKTIEVNDARRSVSKSIFAGDGVDSRVSGAVRVLPRKSYFEQFSRKSSGNSSRHNGTLVERNRDQSDQPSTSHQNEACPLQK